MKTPEQKGELFFFFTVFTKNEDGFEPGTVEQMAQITACSCLGYWPGGNTGKVLDSAETTHTVRNVNVRREKKL